MMNRYSIDEFVKKTQQEDKGEGMFELETPRLLEVNLDGKVWAKALNIPLDCRFKGQQIIPVNKNGIIV